MTDEREGQAPGSESPLTHVFRQLADGADASDAPDVAVRIIDLARQFDAAAGPADRADPASDPLEDRVPPQP